MGERFKSSVEDQVKGRRFIGLPAHIRMQHSVEISAFLAKYTAEMVEDLKVMNNGAFEEKWGIGPNARQRLRRAHGIYAYGPPRAAQPQPEIPQEILDAARAEAVPVQTQGKTFKFCPHCGESLS